MTGWFGGSQGKECPKGDLREEKCSDTGNEEGSQSGSGDWPNE